MFTETGDCGPLYHGGRTLRDPNSSSHSWDKLDRCSGVPEGSETPQCPSWKKFCCNPCICTFCQSPSGWHTWRTWQEVPVERCRAIGSMKLCKGPVMASQGPEGRVTSCNVTSYSFEAFDVVVVRAWWTFFGACTEGEGANHPSTLEEGAQRIEEPTHWLFRPQQPWGLLDGSQEYPPRPAPAPKVPLTPGMLQTSSALLLPSAFLVSAKKEKEKLMRILRKVDLGQRFEV